MAAILWDDEINPGVGPVCPKCGAEMDRHSCWNGCDDGYFTYEEHLQYEDPLWYSPGDEEICTVCNGTGGWFVCGYCAGQEA